MRAASRKGLAIAPPISAGMGSQLFLHIFAVGALAVAKGAGIEASEVEKALGIPELCRGLIDKFLDCSVSIIVQI
jgi:hypothetical protein